VLTEEIRVAREHHDHPAGPSRRDRDRPEIPRGRAHTGRVEEGHGIHGGRHGQLGSRDRPIRELRLGDCASHEVRTGEAVVKDLRNPRRTTQYAPDLREIAHDLHSSGARSEGEEEHPLNVIEEELRHSPPPLRPPATFSDSLRVARTWWRDPSAPYRIANEYVPVAL